MVISLNASHVHGEVGCGELDEADVGGFSWAVHGTL